MDCVRTTRGWVMDRGAACSRPAAQPHAARSPPVMLLCSAHIGLHVAVPIRCVFVLVVLGQAAAWAGCCTCFAHHGTARHALPRTPWCPGPNTNYPSAPLPPHPTPTPPLPAVLESGCGIASPRSDQAAPAQARQLEGHSRRQRHEGPGDMRQLLGKWGG